MHVIHRTEVGSLPDIAACHLSCFQDSLATKLGKRYVAKSLEWFLVCNNRFLFHIEVDNRIAGYCGGFVPQKHGDGSSSGMLQHAFTEAIKAIIFKPLLLWHREVKPQYSFLWRNIKRKLTGKLYPAPVTGEVKPFKPFAGLVVIAVHPDYRGSGVAQFLLQEFEKQALAHHQNELVLTVKKQNARAIKAYQNFGWHIAESQNENLTIRKTLRAESVQST